MYLIYFLLKMVGGYSIAMSFVSGKQKKPRNRTFFHVASLDGFHRRIFPVGKKLLSEALILLREEILHQIHSSQLKWQWKIPMFNRVFHLRKAQLSIVMLVSPMIYEGFMYLRYWSPDFWTLNSIFNDNHNGCYRQPRWTKNRRTKTVFLPVEKNTPMNVWLLDPSRSIHVEYGIFTYIWLQFRLESMMHPRSLTDSPWKLMVGRRSFPIGMVTFQGKTRC